jgi:hypothetical protein
VLQKLQLATDQDKQRRRLQSELELITVMIALGMRGERRHVVTSGLLKRRFS